MYEAQHGNLPHKMDVDHKIPLIKGGSNKSSNFRKQTEKQNRSFPRTRQAGMK